MLYLTMVTIHIHTWWLIPRLVSGIYDITPVINGISRVNPLIIGVITHLLSGMSHQVEISLVISISGGIPIAGWSLMENLRGPNG